MWTSRTAFTAIAVAVLATACGGGGDDGTPVPQGPTLVRISAANQDTVARASTASIVVFTGVPAFASSPSPGWAKAARAEGASALSGHGGLAQLVLRAVDVGARQTASPPTGMARPLAQYQQTEPCLVSGTMTVAWDDKDNNGIITAGDTVSAMFSQCDDGDGQTVNGGMGLAIATYAETQTALDITGSATFQSLAMLDAGESFTLNGGAAFQFNVTMTAGGIDMLGSFTVANSGLTAVTQGGTTGLSDTFSYRAGFGVSVRDFAATVQGVPSSEVITASGDFGSQALGGDLRLSTTTPFKSVFTDPQGDIFPTEGQLFVNGGDGTRLRLTATLTAQVQMDMSDDSDADWEYSKIVDWPWLLP